MSIESEIERIKNNISNAYSKISEKGGTLPENQNSSNLVNAIESISSADLDLSNIEIENITVNYSDAGGNSATALVDENGNSTYGSFFVILSSSYRGNYTTDNGHGIFGVTHARYFYWNNKTKKLYMCGANEESSTYEYLGTYTGDSAVLKIGGKNSSIALTIFKLNE